MNEWAKKQSGFTVVEQYNAVNGHYPITAANLNPDWSTVTARTDSNCFEGTKNSDWVPGLGVTLPQSDTSMLAVSGDHGCYICERWSELSYFSLEYGKYASKSDDV